jgi:hypothetical protein
VALRSAFSRILSTKGFTYMAYALSGLALAIAAMESYSVISNSGVLPDLTGPVLAVIIIGAAFGYGYLTRNRLVDTTATTTTHRHHHDTPSSIDDNTKKDTESH